MSPKQTSPWDYVVDYYDRDLRERCDFSDYHEFMLSFYREVKGTDVLNLGCGPQFFDFVEDFADWPERYVGLDVSEATVSFLKMGQHPDLLRARSVAATSKLNWHLEEGDFLKSDLESLGKFDTVVAFFFIGIFHGAELDQVIERIKNLLKPGGQLIKVTFHGPVRSADETREKLLYGYDSLKEHEPETLVESITSHDFIVERNEAILCDSKAYGWEKLQGCLFRKGASV